jgi:hypothetical protein
MLEMPRLPVGKCSCTEKNTELSSNELHTTKIFNVNASSSL